MLKQSILPESITWHPPDEILEIVKALLDVLTVVAFLILLVIIYYSKNKYPVIERRNIMMPLFGFGLLGFISMTMDALDEFYWFSPQEFYNNIWKPTRLFLFIVAIVLLLISFYYFYQFSDRLFGEDN
ncbi:MAG: hypothetical protein ACTSR2_15115 [Candidatus Hodarchaeales archaeon]